MARGLVITLWYWDHQFKEINRVILWIVPIAREHRRGKLRFHIGRERIIFYSWNRRKLLWARHGLTKKNGYRWHWRSASAEDRIFGRGEYSPHWFQCRSFRRDDMVTATLDRENVKSITFKVNVIDRSDDKRKTDAFYSWTRRQGYSSTTATIDWENVKSITFKGTVIDRGDENGVPTPSTAGRDSLDIPQVAEGKAKTKRNISARLPRSWGDRVWRGEFDWEESAHEERFDKWYCRYKDKCCK